MQSDLVILGSGIGGSITALIANQMGMDVILVEQSSHPRFAIGESSTPQADIALANIATKYNLPRLAPLARYGTWKQTYPELGCGPKRGFTYIHHPNIENELLVESSPDGIDCDSNWLRSDLDAFLVEEVKRTGISYFDNTSVTLHEDDGWKLEADNLSCTTKFLIDATGGSNPLGIEQDCTSFHTNSRAIYSHFNGVSSWGKLHGKQKHPYPCHDSALHHIFHGGWMYVLHFDSGVTSAGFVLDNASRPNDTWESLMAEFPDIQKQFEHATPIRPIVETTRLQRYAKQIVGENWAMLPHSAFFIDPLHSTGIAHTLYGIDLLMQNIGTASGLQNYKEIIQNQARLVDQLIHGSYCCFHDFDMFSQFVMLYFAGADYTERQRQAGYAPDFLHANDQAFCKTVGTFYTHVSNGTFNPNDVRAAIEPWNMVGFCDPSKNNMYTH
jgi:FADH2 O2-dependent halogenase